MIPENDNLEKNISRLVKLAGDCGQPNKTFTDNLINSAIDELTGKTGTAQRESKKTLKIFAYAAAAVILLAATMYFRVDSRKSQYIGISSEQKSLMRENINITGQVTILDAFELARNIREGKKIDKSWDKNDDGVIDKKDVDVLAFAAVHLRDGV
jgi:hypothetical protein